MDDRTESMESGGKEKGGCRVSKDEEWLLRTGGTCPAGAFPVDNAANDVIVVDDVVLVVSGRMLAISSSSMSAGSVHVLASAWALAASTKTKEPRRRRECSASSACGASRTLMEVDEDESRKEDMVDVAI